MELIEIKSKVITALENEGIFIDMYDSDDIDLTNFIDDSIQFISIIVKLEEIFNIEIPNELLIFDNFKSLDYICKLLQTLVLSVESKV